MRARVGRDGRRALLLNLLLVAVSATLLLGVLEVAARLVREDPGEPIAAQYTEFDPIPGWRHRPHAIARFPQGDYAINSRGLRDHERSLDPPASTFRVMLLGDSFAEGFGVPFEDSVAQVLERRLHHAGCAVEVIGAGTVGYSTDQEYLFYRDQGARYGPRLVVLLFYYNDILYNARGSIGRAAKPLLSFADGAVRVQNAPLAAPSNEAQWWRGDRAKKPRLRSLDWLRQRLLTGAPRGHDALAHLGFWPMRDAARSGDELSVFNRNLPPLVLEAWVQTINILRALRDEAARHAARLLIVYVPSKMEVNARDWVLTRESYAVDEQAWDKRQVARWLAEACRDLGISCVDPSEALETEERGPRGPTYEALGSHWNAVGHGVAALAIEGALRRNGSLPACAPGS